MQPVRKYIAIAILLLAGFIFVGLPVLSLCMAVHSLVFFQWSPFHGMAWLHISVLVVLAYYFYDFFDVPRR